VGRGLFVTNQDVPQLGITPEGVVKGKDSPSGIPENDFNAFPKKALADDFRTF
jgi:hypothetical protein